MSNDLPELTDRSSNAVRRVVSLVVGPAYICLISALFAAVTESPFFVVLLIAAGTAAIEMLIISVLAKRWFLSNTTGKRFGLGTLFLLVTGLSIYLGVLSYLVRSYSEEIADLPLITLIPFAGFAFLFMAFSTIALAYFADALLWVGTWAIRKFRERLKQRLATHQDFIKSDGSRSD